MADAVKLIDQKALMRKIALKIVPLVSIGFLLSYLDRTNISMAALTMNADLGLTPVAYGWAVSLFFITYIIFEIPSNMALQRFGARLWLTRIMVTWGLITCATAFAWSANSLFAFRLLLGMAEAGFAVGVVYYFTLWFPQAYRTRILGLFFVTTPLSQVIGSPLGGELLSLNGQLGLYGWQWLFLLEGIPSILLGFGLLLFLPSKPADAPWLDGTERAWLTATLAAEQGGARELHDVGSAMRSADVWRLSLCYLLLLLGILGTGYWLPLMTKTFVSDNRTVGILAAVPSLAAVIGMILWTRLAQRTGWPERHVAAGALLGAAGLLLAAYVSAPLVAFAGMILAFIGLWSSFAVFWALSTRLLTGHGSAAAIALISAVGTLSGVFGPYALGWLLQMTGTHQAGILVMASGAVASALVALTCKTAAVRDGVRLTALRA